MSLWNLPFSIMERNEWNLRREECKLNERRSILFRIMKKCLDIVIRLFRFVK